MFVTKQKSRLSGRIINALCVLKFCFENDGFLNINYLWYNLSIFKIIFILNLFYINVDILYYQMSESGRDHLSIFEIIFIWNLFCVNIDIFYYQMSVSGRDRFYVLLNYVILSQYTGS